MTIWFLFMIQSVNLPHSAHTITSSAHCSQLQLSTTTYTTAIPFSAHTTAATTSSVHTLQPTAAIYNHLHYSYTIPCTHYSSHYIFSAHTAAAIKYSVHTAANCSHLQPPTLQLYHSVYTAATLSDANTIQCI